MMPPPSTPNPSLPDDLLLSCLARVSRLYYPTLSLVSKRFRSLLASPELYKTRSLLGHTESCLYVYLRFLDRNPRWYTLVRNPNQNLTNILVPISIPDSHTASSSLVAFGSKVYNIGSFRFANRSSQMSILDCQSHIWCKGQSMRVERCSPYMTVFDGKIYVVGGCKDCNPANWMEVFDPKTQIWEPVFCALSERYTSCVYNSVVIEGTIYMFGNGLITYKPMEKRWEVKEGEEYWNLNDGCASKFYCVIDDVLYSTGGPYGIIWYDFTIRDWMNLEGLPNFDRQGSFDLVNCGGKMAVFWKDSVCLGGSYKLHCAVIALERRKNREIWGKVEWSDAVLTVPKFYEFLYASATTL